MITRSPSLLTRNREEMQIRNQMSENATKKDPLYQQEVREISMQYKLNNKIVNFLAKYCFIPADDIKESLNRMMEADVEKKMRKALEKDRQATQNTSRLLLRMMDEDPFQLEHIEENRDIKLFGGLRDSAENDSYDYDLEM